MMEIRYGRKRSGIKKALKAKVDEWLATIDDVDVNAMAAKNTIVTGGAIANMLIGEKVNDYDIYFRDKETALQVAKYYVDKFNAANRDWAPEVKTEVIENIKGEAEERVVIFIQSSGVAAEDGRLLDYGQPEQAVGKGGIGDLISPALEDENGKPAYRPVFLSQNAITLSNSVQLIIRFYGEPDQIHANYDFEHACCYWDHGKNELVLPASALECLLSRTLVYRGSLYPIASIFRAKKFVERGWRITAGQLLKIMWQISEIDLSKPAVLREQLTGVDMAYMWELIEALTEADEDKINSAYVATIIDRIFE